MLPYYRFYYTILIMAACLLFGQACQDKGGDRTPLTAVPETPTAPAPTTERPLAPSADEAITTPPEEDSWLSDLEAAATTPTAQHFSNDEQLLASNDDVKRAVRSSIDRLNTPDNPANYERGRMQIMTTPVAMPYGGLRLSDYLDDLCKLVAYRTAVPSAFGTSPAAVQADNINHTTLAYPCVRSSYQPQAFSGVANPNYLPLDVHTQADCDTGQIGNRRIYETILTWSTDDQVTRRHDGGYIVKLQEDLFYTWNSLPRNVAVMENAIRMDMLRFQEELLVAEKTEMDRFIKAYHTAFSENDAAALEQSLVQIVDMQTRQLQPHPDQKDIIYSAHVYPQQNSAVFTALAKQKLREVKDPGYGYHSDDKSGFVAGAKEKLAARMDSRILTAADYSAVERVREKFETHLRSIQQSKADHLALVRGQVNHLAEVEKEWIGTYFSELKTIEEELQKITVKLQAITSQGAQQTNYAHVAAVVALLNSYKYSSSILLKAFEGSTAGVEKIRKYYLGQVRQQEADFLAQYQAKQL